jgi:beta-lactam-binding protein with PASTA domain
MTSPTATITLPDTTGMAKDAAFATLHAAGARDVRVDNTEGTVDFATWKVCSQVPGGGQETSSTLFVTLQFCGDTPAQEAPRPELVGHTVADAERRAQAAGFTGGFRVVEITGGTECKTGDVCSVSPSDWEMESDHELTLYVAKNLTIDMPK